MAAMRMLPTLVLAAALSVAGCGGDDERPVAGTEETPAPTTTPGDKAAAAMQESDDDARSPRRRGTRIIVAESEFGDMLFDSKRQAIYIFEQDPRNASVCYGDCAEAWPPVFADGKPVAAKRVDQGLLGTIKRRGGRRQVTYAGQPLYYYAHENPREVRCHNVNLNGGFWWVLGPDGERRA
jgi:predicted lipoprotein with Yx(FWY)xxD motif